MRQKLGLDRLRRKMNFSIHLFTFFLYTCLLFVEARSDENNLQTTVNNILPVKDIAVIQLSFDGINTFHCGVGTVILQTQTVLQEFNKHCEKNPHFKLYLVSGDYSTQLPEYSAETLERNIKNCNESGGEVYLIPIIKKDHMFGEPKQWQELCLEGAKVCAKIINENTYTIVIAHDTAYAQLPIQLKNLALKGQIKKPHQVLWVPHATSWSYNGHKNGIANWPERHKWELEAYQQADTYNYQIGYISETIKHDLISPPFNVPEGSLMYYRTGILLDKYVKSISENTVADELKKRSIPLDKRLIFTIGRANPLKGQDITLEMYRRLKIFYPDIHLVMLAPPSDYMPSYLQLLKNRIKSENLDVTLIDEFDPDLAHFIYQWPKTSLVSLLSRMDTQPLTVMEARVNPRNCIVLVSDPERMGKQVMDKVDGFTCSLNGLDHVLIDKPIFSDPLDKIVSCARQILDLTCQDDRNIIIEAGKRVISENYDLRKNMIKNLNELFKLKNERISFSFSTESKPL